MLGSAAQIVLKLYLTSIVFDIYSLIICEKSLALNQKNENKNHKKLSQSPSKMSGPALRAPINNDTTILAKLAAHGKEWHYGMHRIMVIQI